VNALPAVDIWSLVINWFMMTLYMIPSIFTVTNAAKGVVFRNANRVIPRFLSKGSEGVRQNDAIKDDHAVSRSRPFIRAGLPFLLFMFGGAYFLSISLNDRLKENEQTRQLGGSKSEREFIMEEEKSNLLRKLQKDIETKDFDNTRRIERPEEVLARRKLEREQRNKWYRRSWRWITGQK